MNIKSIIEDLDGKYPHTIETISAVENFNLCQNAKIHIVDFPHSFRISTLRCICESLLRVDVKDLSELETLVISQDKETKKFLALVQEHSTTSKLFQDFQLRLESVSRPISKKFQGLHKKHPNVNTAGVINYGRVVLNKKIKKKYPKTVNFDLYYLDEEEIKTLKYAGLIPVLEKCIERFLKAA